MGCPSVPAQPTALVPSPRFALWPAVRALLLMLGLTGLAAPALAQAVHPVRIVLEATAPEARLQIDGLLLHETRRQVTFGGALPAETVEGWRIRKPPMDQTFVRLEVDALALATGEPIQLTLHRQALGRVALTVTAAGKPVLAATVDQPCEKPCEPQRWTLDSGRLLAGQPPLRKDFGRKALAFYYGWYGHPSGPAGRWLHWDPSASHHASTHVPELGWYDSAEPEVIRQHVRWAKEAGLDGLVLSVWRLDAHDLLVLERLLAEAARQAPFEVAVYVEAADTAGELHQQLATLLGKHGQHPAWLRADGRPVAFLYTRVLKNVGADGLRRALHGLSVFAIGDAMATSTFDYLDGVHTYVSASVPDRYQQELLEASRVARLRDKLAVATVMPGYDDTLIRTPGGIDLRTDGRFYDGEWARAALSDWVVLTSFNEWHEGSEIEPSREFGRSYLEATRRWIARWRR
jgi:hypothetical protein